MRKRFKEPERKKIMEHTPVPWRSNGTHSGYLVFTEAEPHTDIVVLHNGANAAFIVRAANNHDKLLAALEGMVAMAERPGSCRLCGAGNSTHTRTCAATVARVAIKAAKEA